MSSARLTKIAWRPNTTWRVECPDCGYRSSPIAGSRRTAERRAASHVCPPPADEEN